MYPNFRNLAKILLGIIFTTAIIWAPHQSNAQTQETIPPDELELFKKSSPQEKIETCIYYLEEDYANPPSYCYLVNTDLKCVYNNLTEKNSHVQPVTNKGGVCELSNTDKCLLKLKEIKNLCKICQEGASKINFQDNELTCTNLGELSTKKEYFYDQVNCSNAQYLTCSQSETSTTPKLKPFNSEFFNVNDPESGLIAPNQGNSFQTNETGGGPILSPIYRIINFLIAIIGTLSTFAIVYGSFTMVTSGGDDNRISQGKDIIKNALIALVIVMASYTLVRVTQAIIFNLVN